MFWKKNDKKDNKTPTKNSGQTAEKITSVGKTNGQRPSSEEIREQALANLRAARANLGEETIQKMAEMLKKQK